MGRRRSASPGRTSRSQPGQRYCLSLLTRRTSKSGASAQMEPPTAAPRRGRRRGLGQVVLPRHQAPSETRRTNGAATAASDAPISRSSALTPWTWNEWSPPSTRSSVAGRRACRSPCPAALASRTGHASSVEQHRDSIRLWGGRRHGAGRLTPAVGGADSRGTRGPRPPSRRRRPSRRSDRRATFPDEDREAAGHRRHAVERLVPRRAERRLRVRERRPAFM